MTSTPSNPSIVSSHLRLIVGNAKPGLAAQVAGDRRVFWKVFVNWLAIAGAEETEQLERVLSRHAHHVRPLVDAVSDAMLDRIDAGRLPVTLVSALRAAQWEPASSAITSVA